MKEGIKLLLFFNLFITYYCVCKFCVTSCLLLVLNRTGRPNQWCAMLCISSYNTRENFVQQKKEKLPICITGAFILEVYTLILSSNILLTVLSVEI